MAKKGMARPDWTHPKPKNEAPPVPELQGKAKSGKAQARPIVAGTGGPSRKVYHEKPISRAHGIIDSDLARDNLENDLTQADIQDI